MSEWKFNNKVFEDAPEEYIGFVVKQLVSYLTSK
jgi:hypothetical protein